MAPLLVVTARFLSYPPRSLTHMMKEVSEPSTPVSADVIYADPTGYLRSLGIESELVAESEARWDQTVLAAA
jgi:hypothetical protein